MLDALRFVQGAVATRDWSPVLTHFRIEAGAIRGYNGVIGLRSPIALDLNASPRAIPFTKAIQTCKGTIQLHLTPAGKLAIRSGPFRAFIECIGEPFPEIIPEGTIVPLDHGILPVFKLLLPFIAGDASRPWARGILLREHSAYATNNVTLIEQWLGYTFPVELNIPHMAIVELLRIGEEPVSLQVSETSATFHFPDDRWLRTQLYSTAWPEVERILDQESNPSPVPEGLWSALRDLAPFTDDLGRVYFRPEQITVGREEDSTSVDLPSINLAEACFNYQQLLLLEGVADAIDLSQYPKPCHFYGPDNIRGATIGIRL